MDASGVVFNGGFTTPPADSGAGAMILVAIIVVALCILALLLALAAAGIMVWRRRHLKAMDELTQANLQQEKQISDMTAAEANWKVPLTETEAQVLNESLGPRAMPDTMKRLQITPRDVRLLGQEPIGSGHFADVFIADWLGTPCAVKRLRRSRLTEDGLVCFKAEIALHVTLRHPNIVALLGCSVQPEVGKVQAILELCSRGTLEQVLQNKRLNWSAHKLPIAIGIARAMAYLHAQDPPVIHRDLKPSNVLIDDGYNAKLADFGLAREKDDGMMSNVGTPFFAAPEVLRRVRYDENADVWSFGCVLETLVSHAHPYAWFSPHGEVVEKVAEGELKPNVPPTHFLAQTLSHCVELHATDRPRFDALVETLSSSPMGLAAALQPPGPIDMSATPQLPVLVDPANIPQSSAAALAAARASHSAPAAADPPLGAGALDPEQREQAAKDRQRPGSVRFILPADQPSADQAANVPAANVPGAMVAPQAVRPAMAATAAPAATAATAAPASEGSDGTPPHNTFKPMHLSGLNASNLGSNMGSRSNLASSLASLPFSWPRNRLSEYFDEGVYRPACYPVDDTHSSRQRVSTTQAKAERRNVISMMRARARSQTPLPTTNPP